MKTSKKFLFISLLAVFALIAAGCGAGSPDQAQQAEAGRDAKAGEAAGKEAEFKGPVKIGIIPADNQGDKQVAIKKLTETLTKELGVEVQTAQYPDYNAVVEALNYGNIQVAWLGPLTYVIANYKGGAEAVATLSIDGKPYYYSYLITQKDSPYNSVDDVVANSGEIRFAFGDPSSTSGSLIPGIALKDLGIYESKDSHKFKQVTFTGSHDATALAVQNNQVEVGAIDSAIFERLIKKGVVDESKFKIIWKSDELFQYPWAVAKSVPDKVKGQIQQALVNIKDPEILKAFNGADEFIKASNDDYESIRKAAEADGRLK